MPEVVFEPTIPVFERAKTVHVLHRAVTVIGQDITHRSENPEVQYCFRKHLPLVSILNQKNLLYTLPHCSLFLYNQI
jgi:hypothetical protein